jgi:hypothetical protein
MCFHSLHQRPQFDSGDLHLAASIGKPTFAVFSGRFRVAEFRTFCIMVRNGVARFVGSWISETGFHLRINDYNGIFEVDLWEEGKGFILDLTHEYDYELDPKRREALAPALSRNERDHFLDACYSLFGPLDHFVRRTAKNRRL